jgi:hypothetical protein
MEILIDVEQSPQGRLSGNARLLASPEALAFSGTMELLASVEELCRRGVPTRRPPSCPPDPQPLTQP